MTCGELQIVIRLLCCVPQGPLLGLPTAAQSVVLLQDSTQHLRLTQSSTVHCQRKKEQFYEKAKAMMMV